MNILEYLADRLSSLQIKSSQGNFLEFKPNYYIIILNDIQILFLFTLGISKIRKKNLKKEEFINI
jgi:hypothetical protein